MNRVSTDEVLNKAYRLAYFLHQDKAIAIRIVAAATLKLNVAMAVQSKRLYYIPVGRFSRGESRRTDGIRNKALFSDLHLLQRLVYAESEPYERQKELAAEIQADGDRATEEDLLVYFVKHLVRITTKRNAFYVTLGVSRLLHSYSTLETMEIYNAVIGEPERVKDDYYYRSRKAVLMHEMYQRFGQLIRASRQRRGEERFETQHGSSEQRSLVRECLRVFTPWDTQCPVPRDFDPLKTVIARLTSKSGDDENNVEVNRIHAVLHPDCFGRLVAAFGYSPPEERMELPRFFSQQSDDQSPPRQRSAPADLSTEELAEINGMLAEQKGRRRRSLPTSVIRIMVDGVERATLNPVEQSSLSFSAPEDAETIEVMTRDQGGDLLLATHLITSYRDDEPLVSSIRLESGQKLSLSITRRAMEANGAAGLLLLVFFCGQADVGGEMDDAILTQIVAHHRRTICGNFATFSSSILLKFGRPSRSRNMVAFLPRKTREKMRLLVLVIFATSSVQAQVPKPPPSRVDNFREVIHGVEIVDPYRWLEEQDSPETRTWIDAQNKYTHSLLDTLPARPLIQKRLSELLRVDTVGTPFQQGGRYFLFKKRAADDLSILYVRQGLNGKDEVLIDPHTLSPDHTTDISLLDASSDGKLIVYSVRRGGQDETELRVMDVDARKDVDQLPNALYRGVSMKKDSSGFYYNLQKRDTGIRVLYHAIGTDASKDVEVFGKGYGPDKWIGGAVSEDGKYLMFEVAHGWARNEVYVQKLSGGPIQTIINDIPAHFNAWFAGDRLVMQTDWQAPNQRIMLVDLNNPAREKWQEIVPEGRDAISGFSLVGGKLFVSYLHNVTTQIKIFALDGKALGEVSLPGIGSASDLAGRWERTEAFFSFRSFVTPQTIYRYDIATGKTELWARPNVPFKSDDFEVRQVWYSSKDGTRVPMFLVHKKGLQPDGKLPVLLYGYGGFNVNQTPRFSSSAAIWVEQGGVYALANIRGGGEFGEAWHKAGMLDKKQNVFDDFIGAAEWLIKNKYTNPSRLAIQGGSNGGLLVGAALTQRPELFQAVLCEFPDLDMIGYYRFKNNNPPALLEYGNASDPAQFKYLYAYSPYQKVKPGEKYPAVLFTTGDQDTRVPPLQARKMTARLQAASTSGKPVLLLYDTKAGHAGGRPLSKIIEDVSLELAFLFWQLRMDQRVGSE